MSDFRLDRRSMASSLGGVNLGWSLDQQFSDLEVLIGLADIRVDFMVHHAVVRCGSYGQRAAKHNESQPSGPTDWQTESQSGN